MSQPVIKWRPDDFPALPELAYRLDAEHDILYPQSGVAVPHVGIHPAQAIEAAAVFEAFIKLLNQMEGPANWARRSVDTGYDRFMGGVFMLSMAVGEAIGRVINWVEYSERGGVFVYEELDYGYSNGPQLVHLPVWLLQAIPSPALYEMAENWAIPTNAAIDRIVHDWAEHQGLPVMPMPLTPEEVGQITQRIEQELTKNMQRLLDEAKEAGLDVKGVELTPNGFKLTSEYFVKEVSRG